MKVTTIVPYKVWKSSVTGATASIHGAVPWTRDADKSKWQVIVAGYTWQRDDGRIGLGRVPAKTLEEAVEVMNRVNSFMEPESTRRHENRTKEQQTMDTTITHVGQHKIKKTPEGFYYIPGHGSYQFLKDAEEKLIELLDRVEG